MSFVNRNIKWIMLVSGAFTSTMFILAIAPQTGISLMFGEVLEGPLQHVFVRSWGFLVGSIGLMLMYGASRGPVRKLVLTYAVAGKLMFIGLLLTVGLPFLAKTGPTIILDALMIGVFGLYLASTGLGESSERRS